ncbi:MAG: hypothetical protein ACF8PN_06625 [Phycisphaerales bacterium]
MAHLHRKPGWTPRRVATVVAATALAVAPAALAHDPGYVIYDLGTLGGAESIAWNINEDGHVVGAAQNAAGEWRACIWVDGAPFDLGTLGGPTSRAYGINSARQVVGEADMADGTSSYATGWDPDRGTFNLGALGGTRSIAWEVTDDAEVVGEAENSTGETRAFLRVGSNMTDLGLLPGHAHSGAYARSSNGFTVGWSEDAAGDRSAVYWDRNLALVELDDLDGPFAEARAMNREGIACGYAESGEGEMTALSWDNGVMIALGGFPTGGDSFAYDLNVVPEFIGEAYLVAADEMQAVLWKNDRITNLNTLLPPGSSWDTLLSAHAINNAGQIVGVGRNSNGERHAYLLDPKLGLANPIPGEAGELNLIDAAGATPGARVHIVYGFEYGSTAVPGCPGVNLDIARPTRLASLTADETGHAIIEVFVPQAARLRTTLLQAIEEGSCEKSVITIWTWM